MQDILDSLLNSLGTHGAVAKALGYSERQYYNIRRALDRGQQLNPRVQAVILMRSQPFRRDASPESPRRGLPRLADSVRSHGNGR